MSYFITYRCFLPYVSVFNLYCTRGRSKMNELSSQIIDFLNKHTEQWFTLQDISQFIVLDNINNWTIYEILRELRMTCQLKFKCKGRTFLYSSISTENIGSLFELLRGLLETKSQLESKLSQKRSDPYTSFLTKITNEIKELRKRCSQVLGL